MPMLPARGYDFTLRTKGNSTVEMTESGGSLPPYFNTTR